MNKNILSFTPKVLIIFFLFLFISCKKENSANAESKKESFSTTDTTPKSEDKKGGSKMNLIRNPAVAGAFYPASPNEIKKMISEFFSKAIVPEENKKLLGLVVPHAGYIYSGGVAAYSYKTIKNPDEIETIILLGPSHRVPFKGISVFPGGIYRTPLGDLEIDESAAEELGGANPNIAYIETTHAVEHSLEVQLPFIQMIFKNVKIVPVIFGAPDKEAEERFIDKAVEISKNKKVLFIASSDFSHYYDYETARKMDYSGINSILTMSYNELMNKDSKKEAELCGIYPVLTLIKIMNKIGGTSTKLLHYANSGDVTGDKSQVVGYAAIAFYESGAPSSKKEAKNKEKNKAEVELNSEEKKKLLEIAKDTINEYVKNKKRLKLENITNPKLSMKSGAFVTIKEHGDLRGCIGNFVSDKPLYETIIDMAISAASQDPRFPPVTKGELDKLELEISVLTPLRKISDINEIEVGKHGIYIVKGFSRGVLLPQVATEYGWDRKTFLEQTCRKAGLPKDAWEKGAEIYIFSAQVFSLEDL